MGINKENEAKASAKALQSSMNEIFLSGTGQKEQRELSVIIRADVQGSAEAISSALNQLVAEDDRCKTTVRILSSGVGDVTASDVNLAHVSKAEIIAFNVAANMQAQEEVRKTAVDITYETVIYDILDMLE